jgi:protein ImuB
MPHRARERYERRYDFADPVQSLEGLLFPLRRVLQEFEGYLRGRDVAVQAVDIKLRHRDEVDTAFTLHTSAPIRDSARLFVLLRERLEHTPWKAAVTELKVAARDFHAPEILQGDFFDDSERLSAGWAALLDKLRARLGANAIRQIGLRDDHRPELAWCVLDEPVSPSVTQPFPERPLWLIEPTPVGKPGEILGRPERIEAGWPSGTDTCRDYYIAVTSEGARWWLYRDATTGEWFLQGLWG